MSQATVTTRAYTVYDFGYGKYAPANGDLADYLGRLVTCYHKTSVVVRAEPPLRPLHRLDGSVIPGARLFCVTLDGNGDNLGPTGCWHDADHIAEPCKTVIHWHPDTFYRMPEGEREHRYALYQEVEALRIKRKAEAAERLRLAVEASDTQWKRLTPSWAKAYILAEWREDESDIQSDYFHSRTTRRVVLAFSKHTRNLFPELRKAAGLFPEAAHLATEGEEHREDYSGGSGLYLGGKRGKWSGWIVRKHRIWGDQPPSGESHLAEFLPALKPE